MIRTLFVNHFKGTKWRYGSCFSIYEFVTAVCFVLNLSIVVIIHMLEFYSCILYFWLKRKKYIAVVVYCSFPTKLGHPITVLIYQLTRKYIKFALKRSSKKQNYKVYLCLIIMEMFKQISRLKIWALN